MMKKINIYQIDAFTKNPFEGNPAAVTFGDELSEEQMQTIAREMNLSETAFISKSEKADFNLRWFTPTNEVELCGHGTIASLHFLNEKNLLKQNSEITFDTLSGILKCRFEDDRYFMQIPVYSMNDFQGNKNEVLKTLGLNERDNDKNSPPVLLENGNLYIHINKLETVKNLQPDFKRLKSITGKGKDFEGVVVFTLETIDKKSFAHLRYFVPAHGIDEDPVTGSANGPLILVLKFLNLIEDRDKIELTFEQGDFLNRKGRIDVSFDKTENQLFISGNAATVMKGELFL